MRIKAGLSRFTLVAAVVLSAACDDSPEEQGSTGGAGGETAMRGRGGNGGVTNTPVTPETGTLPPPETMQCGETLCRDMLVGDIVLSPCCSGGDACGLDLTPIDYLPIQNGCAELRQPGSQDTDCPSYSLDDPVAPMDLPGCCMPSGQCGVVANLVLVGNFGCVDPRDFLTDDMNVPDRLQPCVPVEDDAGAPPIDVPDASVVGGPDASTFDPMNPSDAG